jgi:hypothetical protein
MGWVVDEIYRAFDSEDSHRKFDELDAHYALVQNDDDMYVVDRERNPRTGKLIMHSFQQFGRVLIKERLLRKKKAKNGKVMTVSEPLADAWLRRPQGRVYRRLVVEPPEYHAGEWIYSHDHETEYNAWSHFQIDTDRLPASPADAWKHMRGHLLNVWCRGNEQYFNYLLDWLAASFQFPGKLPRVAVVVYGPKGAGKNIVVDYLEKVYGVGSAVTLANADDWLAKFNILLFGKSLIVANEAFWAGNHDHEGTLKQLITDGNVKFEGKFKDPIYSRNFAHVIILGNNEWQVPASFDERRFFVLEIGDEHARTAEQSAAYFTPLISELNGAGPAGMFAELLYRKVDLRAVQDRPRTPYLRKQQDKSMAANDAWWQAKLWEGQVFEQPTSIGVPEFCGDWPTWVLKDRLHEDYVAFVGRYQRRGERALDPANFAVWFRKRCLPSTQAVVDGREGDGERRRYWILPVLQECRDWWARDVRRDAEFAWPELVGQDVQF